MTKTLREKLSTNQNITGIMIKDFLNPIIVPLLDEIDYDFIVIDQEHAPASYLDIQNLVISAKNYNISIIVRPPKISSEHISKVLDMGVGGIMVPHVDTVEDAKNVVNFAKYPPLGQRSYGMRKHLSKFGPFTDSADYIRKANENLVIFIQIESQEAIKNLSKIVALEEIDGIIIGPADLTMDLGIIGQYENQKFEDLVHSVLKQCKEQKKSFGIHFNNIELIDKWKKKGVNILLFSSISHLVKKTASEIMEKLNQ